MNNLFDLITEEDILAIAEDGKYDLEFVKSNMDQIRYQAETILLKPWWKVADRVIAAFTLDRRFNNLIEAGKSETPLEP